jgi:hypothetical protein
MIILDVKLGNTLITGFHKHGASAALFNGFTLKYTET